MHFVIFQVIVAALIAGGWALLARSVRALPYGVLLGVFANLVATIIQAVVRPTIWPYVHPITVARGAAYVAVAAVVAGGVVGLIGYGAKRLSPDYHNDRQRPWRILLAILGYGLAGCVAGLAFFLSRWTINTFHDVQADQLLFFMLGGNPGATPEMVTELLNVVVIPVRFTALAPTLLPLLWLGWRGPERAAPVRLRTVRRVSTAAMATLVAVCVGYSFTVLPLAGVMRTFFVRSTFIEENYVEPTEDILHFPDKPKNFVHIYLESMENSYYSKDQGGYLDQDLMPDLGKLTDENITFSNRDGYGGPLQTMGANHSVAGMLNFQAGVPMIPLFNSTTGGRVSYPDFDTIGDLLHEHGYKTSFMLGTGGHWHHMDQYYKQHGDFDIFDLRTARERGLVPPDYAVWWGIEDDKLYEYAKDEMTKLAAGDKPFYFILENADTHNNDGYLSPRATEFPSDSQYGNVIHYSQGEVVKLVRWIQAQPWYKDTVIVLTGDHQSMDVNFFTGWDKSYERTVVNVFINGALPDPGRERTHNRQFAPFDFFPTILATLGVTIDGDRLGLGTNLYSDKPTLVEQYGFDKVNDEFSKRSTFYEEHRASDLKRPDRFPSK